MDHPRISSTFQPPRRRRHYGFTLTWDIWNEWKNVSAASMRRSSVVGLHISMTGQTLRVASRSMVRRLTVQTNFVACLEDGTINNDQIQYSY